MRAPSALQSGTRAVARRSVPAKRSVGRLPVASEPRSDRMVDLSGKGPFGQQFDNYVFIVPAILIVAFAAFCGMKLWNSINDKEIREAEKRAKREEKKLKKTK